MAQPGVAREPSMEEILASIRQIIESNEPGAGKAISASLPPVYGAEEENDSEIHLTVDDTYAGVEFPEPPALRPDPRFVAANSAGTAPEPEMPARAMSLADVAARVRAASERSAVQTPRDMPQQFREPEPQFEPRAAAASRPVEPAQAPRVAPIAPVAQYAPEPAPVFAEQRLPEVQQPAIVEAASVSAAAHQPAEAAPARAAEDIQPSLLSQNTGLQVARSFEELAAAIDGAAERRSLDEIAEDMLRPMLREWLDDNLPTLVERLVREEIERVARGPRR
ncbi:PopZ family protein [Rhizobium sp. GCM10022189]|uniref:PopZ family protein n=1 Tax=Rhizobium sp. GCM10022189 TaxID=3252654 RepID=UPI000DD6CC19